MKYDEIFREYNIRGIFEKIRILDCINNLYIKEYILKKVVCCLCDNKKTMFNLC